MTNKSSRKFPRCLATKTRNRRQRESGELTAVPNRGEQHGDNRCTKTRESGGRETFGRSVQLRPSAHLKRSLIFKEMIVILSCHGYGGLSFVAGAVEERTEHNAAGKRSFFRVSRCNFNKSWISGWANMEWMRGGRAMGQGFEEQLANLVYHESGAPSTLRWINLSSRHHLHVRPLRLHFSSSFLPLFLFSVSTGSLSRTTPTPLSIFRSDSAFPVIGDRASFYLLKISLDARYRS